MGILVDSSVWIDYFSKGIPKELDFLIDNGNIITNQLILAELIPYLKIEKQNKLIDLLYSLERIPLNIDWAQITEYQYK